jgi:hypothetical protein
VSASRRPSRGASAQEGEAPTEPGLPTLPRRTTPPPLGEFLSNDVADALNRRKSNSSVLTYSERRGLNNSRIS